MSADKIKIDGDAISSSLSNLERDLTDFENALVELGKTISIAGDELTGAAYSKLFETAEMLIAQQKEVLAAEQLVKDEIIEYVGEMIRIEGQSRVIFLV